MYGQMVKEVRQSEMPFPPKEWNIYLIFIVSKGTGTVFNVIPTTILWGRYYYSHFIDE